MTNQRLPFEAQREVKRRLSNRDRVLARLKEGPASTLDLIVVGGTRAPGRVWELRQDGWPVMVEDHGEGKFIYKLTGPQVPSPAVVSGSGGEK